MATPTRRTWAQRLTFALVVVTAIACFATAGALAAGQWVLSQRRLVELDAPSTQHREDAAEPVVIVPGATTTVATGSTTTTTTIALAEPDAANFLVTGADNGDCLGDATPTVGDRTELGERSDTIMIWRANPSANQLAVLSLPRDLYVDIAGGRKARINSAFRRDDPSRLIDTIYLNFGIPIDHYVQVDFCAFKRLVDAVGGVPVPFQYPARDPNSGLLVPEAGCVNLDGDAALAYVRSRKYQYEDPPGSGNWVTDPTSDFGRISRQQDFLRRTVAKIIDDGLYSPDVASALISTNRDYLVTDAGLTPRRMLEFANTLRRLDPDTITTYRIESTSETTSGGDKVERPRIGGDNMQAILAVFRGEATLAAAPEQVLEASTTVATTVVATTVSTTEPRVGGDDAAGDMPSTTLPTVEAEENVVGVAPTRDESC
jgi:LCP family protein required for cell wall assembly